MYHNKKGFTLIEIVVSIAIASIVLMIAGTLILSSSGLLTSTTESDIDKRIVDSIIDFVREEIEYSSDVRLIKNDDKKYKPSDEEMKSGDWHYFYVKGGQLYRDDKDIFGEGFYSHKQFEMSTQGNYENSQRLDIKYSLQGNGEEKYSSRDTVVLLNFSASDDIKKNGLYTSTYKSLSQEAGEDNYVIYYNKKYSRTLSNESALTGTVADIQDNMFYGNYKGMYIQNEYIYRKGEIVWYNGFWWERLDHDNNNVPGENYSWKCLSENYTNIENGVNKLKSSYEKNDIVIFEGYYYQMINSSFTDNDWAAKIDPNIEKGAYWQRIGAVGNAATEEIVKKNKYARRNVYDNENIVKKYFPSSVNMKDPSRSSVQKYSPTAVYKVGDIVRLVNFYDRKSQLYDLYIKIADASSLDATPDNGPSTGWVKIDVSYSGKSSYAQGDIVILESGTLPWIQAKENVLDTNNPTIDINNNGKYWKINSER